MRKVLPKLRQSSGFTIIELMIVMTVIAILSTMVLYGLGKAQAAARDATRQQKMTGVQAALERYYGDCQGYPNTNYAGLFVPGTAVSCGTSLVRGGYLSGAPVDPGGTPATYTYGSQVSTQCGSGTLPDAYQLTLTKESGGTSYFCSPN